MRIRDRFMAIPDVLKRQILRRGLIGCAFLIFSMAFLILGHDAFLVLPGIGFAVFSMASAAWLFYVADQKRYVVVEGICLGVVKSLLFKRVKTVTLEVDGRTLLVQLKQHKRSYKVGAKLRLYLQENAKIYERDRELVVYEYISLTR